jgi:hypothetical protein
LEEKNKKEGKHYYEEKKENRERSRMDKPNRLRRHFLFFFVILPFLPHRRGTHLDTTKNFFLFFLLNIFAWTVPGTTSLPPFIKEGRKRHQM